MLSSKTNITPVLESNFKFQVANLAGGKAKTPVPEHTHPSITISREFGCEGFPLAHTLAEKLSKRGHAWNIYTRDIFNQISVSTQYTEQLLEEIHHERRNQLQQYLDQLFTHIPTELALFKQFAQNVKAVAHKGHAIIVGSGGAVLGQGDKHQFHVRLVAGMDFKIARLKPLVPKMSPNEMIETIEHTNENRNQFIRDFTTRDIKDPSLYDVIINNDRFSVGEMADLIINAMELRQLIAAKP